MLVWRGVKEQFHRQRSGEGGLISLYVGNLHTRWQLADRIEERKFSIAYV